MKIGDVVKDKITNQYGVIVRKYDGSCSFDWEVLALGQKFVYGHIWVDCREEKDLSLRSRLEVTNYLILDLSFVDKIKLLFMSKDIFPNCEICENKDMICEYCYKLEDGLE